MNKFLVEWYRLVNKFETGYISKDELHKFVRMNKALLGV